MSHIILANTPPFCQQLTHELDTLTISSTVSGDALRIGLLNLMPTKEVTERQWLRLLAMANVPLPIELNLLKLPNWQPTHISPIHMAQYYQALPQGEELKQFDAFIMTGAPLGKIPYADVKYWTTIQTLISQLNIAQVPTLYSCWAAQAALYHSHGIATVRKPNKLSGVFAQHLGQVSFAHGRAAEIVCALKQHVLPIAIPQSRFALPQTDTLNGLLNDPRHPLQRLLYSEDTGASCIYDEARGDLMLLGHPEYEFDTLALEYQRDLSQDETTQPPAHYDIKNIRANQQKSAEWQALGALILERWLSATQHKLRC